MLTKEQIKDLEQALLSPTCSAPTWAVSPEEIDDHDWKHQSHLSDAEWIDLKVVYFLLLLEAES